MMDNLFFFFSLAMIFRSSDLPMIILMKKKSLIKKNYLNLSAKPKLKTGWVWIQMDMHLMITMIEIMQPFLNC